MEIQFLAKKMELTPEIKSYVTEKLDKIIKYAGYAASDIKGIHIDISRNFAHENTEDLVRLEINFDLLSGQKVLRAVDTAETAQKAMDLVEKELSQQLRKIKRAKKDKKREGSRIIKKMLSFSSSLWGKKAGEVTEKEESEE